jgi:hypothetical protein
MTNKNLSFVQALSNAFQAFRDGAGDGEDDPNSQAQTAAAQGAQNDNRRDGAEADFRLHFSSAQPSQQQHSEIADYDPSSQHDAILPSDDKMAT